MTRPKKTKKGDSPKKTTARRPAAPVQSTAAKPAPAAATPAKAKAAPAKAAPAEAAPELRQVTLQPVLNEERRRMIEEAAYYRAERRAPGAGDPLADWAAAEAEIDALLAAEGRA